MIRARGFAAHGRCFGGVDPERYGTATTLLKDDGELSVRLAKAVL